MSVVIKKSKLALAVLSILTVIPEQGLTQDLFSDSFLSDPSNKSITVSSSDTIQSSEAIKVSNNTTSADDMMSSAMEEISIDNPASEIENTESDIEIAIPEIAKEEAVEETITEALPETPVEPELVAVEETSEEVAAKTEEPEVAKIVEPKAEEIAYNKETPSEKVIGTISNEMFQEMANLEKENSLLGLQLKQEKLKNEISTVKAMQRQSLMDEVEKRELSARGRVEWEYEQELKEIEVWEKRQRAEYLAKQIEGLLDGSGEASDSASSSTTTQEGPKTASEIYYIIEIRGLSDDLVAKIADNEEKKVFFVKAGSFLPTGHKVMQIAKDHVKVLMDDKEEVIGFSVTKSE